MHIYTPIIRQQIPHEHQPLIDHGNKAVRPLAPGVAIGQLFEHVGPLGKGLVADLDIHRKIGAHVEGRVDVDELDAALPFYLLPNGAVFKRREDEFVVAPYKLVRPAGLLTAALVEEQPLVALVFLFYLRGGAFFPGVLVQGIAFLLAGRATRLVHLLYDLEGEDDISHLVGLAVPDELHFAFVVEQKEPVFVGKGPFGFYEFE
ncbi:MAG: hypothetical protein BWY96_02775 [Spirochaetes bacterium ADurb.BinA120]|nr:MAG: hypothetical protein BWY96_02775 [Spirochaetes bacterium ADurb.BinA120]